MLFNVAFIMFQSTQRHHVDLEEIDPVITRESIWAKHIDITQDIEKTGETMEKRLDDGARHADLKTAWPPLTRTLCL